MLTSSNLRRFPTRRQRKDAKFLKPALPNILNRIISIFIQFASPGPCQPPPHCSVSPPGKPTSSSRETKIPRGMAVRLLRAALGLPLAAAARPEANRLPIRHAGWQRHHPCPHCLPAGPGKDFELAPYPTSTATLRRRRQRPSTETTRNNSNLSDEPPTSRHPSRTGNPLQKRTRRAESPHPNPEFRSFPTRRRSASSGLSEHTTASSSESGSDSDSSAATPLSRYRRRSANPTAETTRHAEREADALWRRYWD